MHRNPEKFINESYSVAHARNLALPSSECVLYSSTSEVIKEWLKGFVMLNTSVTIL